MISMHVTYLNKYMVHADQIGANVYGVTAGFFRIFLVSQQKKKFLNKKQVPPSSNPFRQTLCIVLI